MRDYNLKPIVMLVFLVFLSLSCEEQAADQQLPISRIDLNDQSVINELRNKFQQNSSGRLEAEFDWDQTAIVTVAERDLDYDIYSIPSASNQYSRLGIYQKPDGTMASMVVVSTPVQNDVVEIKYLTLENEPIANVTVDLLNESVDVVAFVNADGRAEDCGQWVAECMDDSYTEHGWFSVALWGLSMLGPEVPLVVAGACAWSNCIDWS